MAKLSFLDYAEQDYLTFKTLYDANVSTNTMGYIAAQACEKYLKHVLCVALDTTDYTHIPVQKEKLHSLKSIAFYLKDELGVSSKYEFRQNLGYISRLYFSMKYPGYEDSHIIDRDEIQMCARTLKECRDFTKTAVYFLENKKDAEQEDVHIEM